MTSVSQNAPPGAAAVDERLLAPAARLLHYLETKDDVLLVTTSNRYHKHTWDTPKTSELAHLVQRRLEEADKRVVLLDAAKLRIHTCEGNISTSRGNHCGVPDSRLVDQEKNPTGHHRCWASFNNADDELYVVSRALFAAKVVVFFVSVRWGQTNSIYQRLLERLTWIENRVSTLGEPPIPELASLEAGLVVFGHNWNDDHVLATQRRVFQWFGWKAPEALSFAWQHTSDENDESPSSYLGAVAEFRELVRIGLPRRR